MKVNKLYSDSYIIYTYCLTLIQSKPLLVNGQLYSYQPWNIPN